MGVIRYLLASVIYLLDFVLKFVVGYVIVLVIWLPLWLLFAFRFSLPFIIAACLLGVCINGFFEGCDIFLIGWAKRVGGYKEPIADPTKLTTRKS
jgi:hypothetical protein